MNIKNFEYLRDQVKFSGFGEGLEKELKEKIEKQLPEFQLNHRAEFGKDVVTTRLDFNKSKNSDMYFFNQYVVSFKPENSKELMNQTFYMGKWNNITLKEAYNMMNGRAVYKEFHKMDKDGEDPSKYYPTGQKYNAWVQMDFKNADQKGNFRMEKYHENYGFVLDFDVLLAKYPFKELQDENSKQRLVESIQKGNRQAVTLVDNGEERKYYIEANPQYKTVNVYDSNMQQIQNRESRSQSQAKENKEGEKNSLKADSDEPAKTEKKEKRIRQGIS